MRVRRTSARRGDCCNDSVSAAGSSRKYLPPTDDGGSVIVAHPFDRQLVLFFVKSVCLCSTNCQVGNPSIDFLVCAKSSAKSVGDLSPKLCHNGQWRPVVCLLIFALFSGGRH